MVEPHGRLLNRQHHGHADRASIAFLRREGGKTTDGFGAACSFNLETTLPPFPVPTNEPNSAKGLGKCRGRKRLRGDTQAGVENQEQALSVVALLAVTGTLGRCSRDCPGYTICAKM